MAGQAGCLQGQDRSVVTHPSSSHDRRCLIWLSRDNRRTRYTTPLAIVKCIFLLRGAPALGVFRNTVKQGVWKLPPIDRGIRRPSTGKILKYYA
ncbi:hypothetical protein J6590_009293 [Homalodisca vitripennis]|nr:hypothetical protein J6590_009293 [Homalodisca vitripennis]